MKSVLISILLLFFIFTEAQSGRLYGIVQDAKTREVLAGASLTVYQSEGISGGITNGEGKFSISQDEKPDSFKISMIGYRSRVYNKTELTPPFLSVVLVPEPAFLMEVVVHPIDPAGIVRQAIEKIPVFIPAADFESRAFYREIIRDRASYYSVAEAIFKIQMLTKKKSFKLSMEKGRSKEDVAYTRLFEDYHPGGGPEDAIGQSLVLHRPTFLDAGRMKNYIYKRDSTIQSDDHTIYVISFDQKPGIHEALEKGLLYIRADDFSVLKFEARNSPAGSLYIKSLTGSDKLFAGILHINLLITGWSRSATFEKINDKVYLGYAKMDYGIDYKQPKKNLDLHLNINTELLVTDFQRPVAKEISGSDEWKRKDLVANLPADFDPDFWGAGNILDPTSEVSQIIASIGKKNNDAEGKSLPEGWLFLNKGSFVAYGKADSITMIPIFRSSWDDNETGSMIYKNISGNFNMGAKLSVTRRSNAGQEPDNGFQQSGILIRGTRGKDENNLIVSLGTGGNSIPKYFFRKTENGKTKTSVDKTSNMTGWIRIEKREKQIIIYRRSDENSSWEKWNEYEADWLTGNLEVGFTVMAHFAGDGPKQRPDMKAVFSKVQLVGL